MGKRAETAAYRINLFMSRSRLLFRVDRIWFCLFIYLFVCSRIICLFIYGVVCLYMSAWGISPPGFLFHHFLKPKDANDQLRTYTSLFRLRMTP